MVRCGLIGCGSVAEEMHIPALHALPDVQVQAVCDIDKKRAEAFAARHAILKAAGDVRTFLRENEDLDFVIVATPGYTHYELLQQLLEARLAIFVEKPLALSLADALDLQRRASCNNVKVCVGQTWRFRDPVLQAKRAQEQGLVGQVYQVNIAHHTPSLFHASVPSWCWEEKEHKVLLFEHAIHLLDMQVYFAGPVRKILGIKAVHEPHLRVTTHVYVLVEHESGAVGIIDLQQFASSHFTYFELYGTANDIQIKFFPHAYRLYSGRLNPLDELYGDLLRIKDFIWPLLKARFYRQTVPRRAVPHYRMLRQFVVALRDDTTPIPVTLEDVLPTMSYLEQLSNAVYG